MFSTLKMLLYLVFSVLRSRSRWSRNYLRSGAGGGGAEIIFLINVYCGQFGGCWDKEKQISTSIETYFLWYNYNWHSTYSFKWHYTAKAGAEIRDKGGAEAETEK